MRTVRCGQSRGGFSRREKRNAAAEASPTRFRILLFALFLICGCESANQTAELRAGYSALDQREYDQALAAADEFLEVHPTGSLAADAMYLRGRAIEQRIKRDDSEANTNLMQARAAYEKALELNRSRELESYIRTSLGNVHYWLDDYAAAEAQWSQSYPMLEGDDLKSWVLYRIGLSQQRQSKWAQADATFGTVREKYPNTEPARRAATHAGARAFYIQVAAFLNPGSAEKTALTLRSRGVPAALYLKESSKLQIVLAGPVAKYAEAASVRSRLLGEFPDAMIVP